VTSAGSVLAALPLRVERYRLERRSVDVSSGFVRVTTTVHLEGGGETGVGEDVSYDAADHDAWPARLPLARPETLEEFSARLDRLDLFPRPPARAAARDARRWALESAALDLALRQAGLSLGGALKREYHPVRFVISTRLEIDDWLDIDPDLEFKLDPTPDWSDERIGAAAASGRVRALDFKGWYEGTEVDVATDPALYRKVVEAFPDAILEDPAWTEETAAILEPHRERIAFDAPVHSLADLDALPVEPAWINVKPSRFGQLAELLRTIEACDDRGIRLYGGGQFELGVGRGQIQALASLLYPDAPNDVAPAGYNAPEPRAGLPRSPLVPLDPPRPGFGWDDRPPRVRMI
jgi:hypothetical protein